MGNETTRYRILESLGKGGMGEVFLADDTQLERKVAIKFLPENLRDDPVARGRFEREAKSAAALDHPYICKIHEFTEVDGQPCIVMEHVAGQTLESRLAQGPLAPAEAIQLAAEVAEALEQAHARRILHRDLKPSNLMLTPEGHVKVMDFGLAKRLHSPGGTDSEDLTPGSLTATGTLLGTPAYMAPEQIRGEPADTRSDIFSFGVVLFELLTREHPFKRGTVSETIAAILRDPPSGGAGSGDQIDYAIFDKLLAKAPAERYQSFDEVSVEVRRLRDVSSTWTEPVSAAADEGEPTVGGRRTQFVGRDAEQAELGRWLDRAARGRGGLVLVGGEPGVGKTRLVEQVLDTARQQRCLTLTGRCYEMEGTAPFIPFVEIIEQYTRVAPSEVLRETLGDAAPEVARLVPDLRRVLADIPPPLELPPEQQRHYLFKNVAEFLERMSRVSSTVLLLDDLQWADNATLLLLHHLAPLLGQLPVLVLGTYRDVELDVNRPFAATLEALNRKRLAQRLNLQRLPAESAAGMLAALGGASPPEALVAGIYRETEGNPFFVEEVYQHLEDEGVLHRDDGTWRPEIDLAELDVPEGVRLVIGRRLERVSADSRKVLMFGAVVGRGFALDLLEAVGDVTGDALLTALEEAEANYLIMPMLGRAPRWEFSHALIRQTLAAGLSLPRRQRLHLKVAEAVERAAGSNPERHASDLAHHLFQAGTAADADKTVRFLTMAGDQAQSAGAFDEALRQFNDALLIQEGDDPRQVADLRYKRGRTLRSLGRWEETIDEWQQALSIYEELGDPASLATVCRELATLQLWADQVTDAVVVTRRVLEVLGPATSADRCRLLAIGGWGLGLGAERSEAVVTGDEMLSESLAMAETLGDSRAHGDVLHVRTYKHFLCMRRRDQADTALRAAELLRSAGDLWNLADVLAFFQWASVSRGRLDGVARFEEEAETQARRLGNMGAEFLARVARASRDWLVSADLDRFEASLQQIVEFCARAHNPWGALAETCLAIAGVWRGRWAEAGDRAEDIARREPAGFMVGATWAVGFLCDCLSGQKQTALARLEERRSHLPRPGRPNPTGAWSMLFGVIEGLAVLGEREAVAELYPLALDAIETGAVVSFHSHYLLQRVAGIAATGGPQWEQAEIHYQTAFKQAHEIPFRSEQPEVRRWYAQMLLDRNGPGDRDKARTMLGEAVEMYETIGMPRHLEMAREMLKGV